MVKDILLAGAGGFAGSALRCAVSIVSGPLSAACGFPVGTLLVNAAGSMLIGALWAALPECGWQMLGMAGFCGGFTTFSAFSLDAFRLLRNGHLGVAVAYVSISVLVCLLLVWAGFAVVRKVAA